jgi:hypothetical protein
VASTGGRERGPQLSGGTHAAAGTSSAHGRRYLGSAGVAALGSGLRGYKNERQRALTSPGAFKPHERIGDKGVAQTRLVLMSRRTVVGAAPRAPTTTVAPRTRNGVPRRVTNAAILTSYNLSQLLSTACIYDNCSANEAFVIKRLGVQVPRRAWCVLPTSASPVRRAREQTRIYAAIDEFELDDGQDELGALAERMNRN